MKWKIDNLSGCWFAVVEGTVQVLHFTPLHTSLEMFHQAKAQSLDSSSSGRRQAGKSKKNIAKLPARNYQVHICLNWLGALRTVGASTKVLLFPVRKLSGCIVFRCFKITFAVQTRETFSPQPSTPALHITAYQPANIYEGGFCQNSQGHLLSHLRTHCSLYT